MVALHQRQHTRTPHTEEQTSQANGKLDSKESNALHRRISLPYDHVFKCTYQKKKKKKSFQFVTFQGWVFYFQ